MSKLLSEYQGKRATSIALPKLSPTAPSRAAVTTAIQGTTSLQSSLATMSKFLEERALQASIQSGFDYSLANQPTAEEIDGMIEKKEEKIPFQPNSMNIAELTANEYISAEIRGQAENKAKTRLHKLFNEDFYNANNGEGMGIDEADELAKNIIDNFAGMFANNRTTFDAFVNNMKVYSSAQRNSALNTSLALRHQQQTNRFEQDLKTLNEANNKIYDVGGITAVNNGYENLFNQSETTMGANSETMNEKIRKAKDVAIQKLVSDQYKKFFDDVPDINNPNVGKIQILADDVASIYPNEPEKAIAILTQGMIDASDNEPGLNKLLVLENINFQGKKINEYEFWDDYEREATSKINAKQEIVLDNIAKAENNTGDFFHKLVIEEQRKDPSLKTRSGLAARYEKYLKDLNLVVSPNRKEKHLDNIVTDLQAGTPDLSIEAMADIKRGIRKQSVNNKESAAVVTANFLDENFVSAADRAELTSFGNNFQNVDTDPDFQPFSNATKARIELDPMKISSEDQLAKIDETKDFYLTHVLTKNLDEISQTMSGDNLDIKRILITDTPFASQFELSVTKNFRILVRSILEEKKAASGNQDLTLADISYESLDNDSKRRIATAMTYHGQFLFITGLKDEAFFRQFIEGEPSPEGESYFDILGTQENLKFNTEITLKEGQSIEVEEE